MGPPIKSASDFGKFDPNKCHGRKDVACEPFGADPNNPSGYGCVPTCRSDADCPAPRKCDPRDKVCVDKPHTGGGIGADCEQWELSGGDAGIGCAGICLHTIAQVDAGQMDPLNQVYFCSEVCVFGDIFGPACGYKETVPRAVCIYATSEAGNGDYGFCAQLCDKDSDCLNQNANTWCDTSWAQAFKRGLCDFKYGKKDAGAGG
jgi:hypothetical protein